MSGPDVTLDLVIVSDLIGGGPGLPPSGPIRVEAADWNKLPGRLGAELPALGLRFSSLRAFRPEELVEQVPALRALADVKRSAGEARSGKIGYEALRAAAAAAGVVLEPPTPPEPSGSPAQDQEEPRRPGEEKSLFDLIDVAGAGRGTLPDGSNVPATARHELDRLLGSLFGPTTADQHPSAATLSSLVTAVDQEIARRLHGILHDPAFRTLEAAWMGLRFLCQRIDFRSGVRLYVQTSARDDLLDALRERLVPFADAQHAEARTVCVLLDFEFDASEEDLGLLSEIGALAASRHFPVVAPLASVCLQNDLSDPIGGLRQEWERFRLADEAEWTTLAANRFLLRLPYGAETDAVRGVRFEEQISGSSDLLWGGAHWLLGATIAGSFARTGWGVDLTGARTGGLIEDLLVTAVPIVGGETTVSPLEHLPNESATLRWIGDGLAAVAGRRNSDQAMLVGAPVIHRSEQTLAQRLFEAQVEAQSRSIRAFTDGTKSVEEIAATISAGLNFLATGPSGPLFRVATEPAPTTPVGASVVALRVTPDRPPLRGLDPFLLRIDRS